ncbi:hypothetical protein M422DRAFT_50209 [Sphaerobolus stellatus SS14]|uniref:Uncharacterized protein n=1 Tax=Sphaerobolus stellatus (strain SS14) TaxID=990650 RepID=A0A0C9USS5_SPHS4|nr:hypothetical protein M422DRAFT_50209 [Sphaerobolus stellatus SS14]
MTDPFIAVSIISLNDLQRGGATNGVLQTMVITGILPDGSSTASVGRWSCKCYLTDNVNQCHFLRTLSGGAVIEGILIEGSIITETVFKDRKYRCVYGLEDAQTVLETDASPTGILQIMQSLYIPDVGSTVLVLESEMIWGSTGWWGFLFQRIWVEGSADEWCGDGALQTVVIEEILLSDAYSTGKIIRISVSIHMLPRDLQDCTARAKDIAPLVQAWEAEQDLEVKKKVTRKFDEKQLTFEKEMKALQSLRTSARKGEAVEDKPRTPEEYEEAITNMSLTLATWLEVLAYKTGGYAELKWGGVIPSLRGKMRIIRPLFVRYPRQIFPPELCASCALPKNSAVKGNKNKEDILDIVLTVEKHDKEPGIGKSDEEQEEPGAGEPDKEHEEPYTNLSMSNGGGDMANSTAPAVQEGPSGSVSTPITGSNSVPMLATTLMTSSMAVSQAVDVVMKDAHDTAPGTDVTQKGSASEKLPVVEMEKASRMEPAADKTSGIGSKRTRSAAVTDLAEESVQKKKSLFVVSGFRDILMEKSVRNRAK